jgi:hypothetical protein
MAINQNHLFEELNGVKCAIVEKNTGAARVAFLRKILEFNRYTVVVVSSPPPKAATAATAATAAASAASAPAATRAPTAGSTPETGLPVAANPAAETPPAGEATPVVPPPPPAPETFTIGVTDTMFNPVNAIFGRLLRTPTGHIVTLAYWQQREKESNDEVPYFE